jgi:hypothetical protein
MPLDDARDFVAKMKEGGEFRESVLKTAGLEEFASLMRAEGLVFDQRDLAGAVAECMREMERLMKN